MSDNIPADEAATWHARLSSGTADTADFAAFERWLARPENRHAFDGLDRNIAWLEADPAAFAAALEGRSTGTVRRRGAPAARLAWRVGFPAILAAAAALLVAPMLQDRWTRYETTDAPREIRLQDGSLVTLNRNSALRISLQAGRRQATLDGEATFDVAHDPARPFTIGAGDASIRVLGTEFNVLNADDRTAVTVRRGVVQVTTPGGETSLRRGEQCAVLNGQCPARQVDPENVFAWRQGRLVYDDAALGDVIADLNRYYPHPVRAAGPGTEALRFSGVLVLDGEDKIVSRLEAFLPVAATREADAIVLRRAEQR